GVGRNDDIYNMRSVDRSSETATQNDLRERALRSIDTSQFPDGPDAQQNVKNLIENVDTDGSIARRVLQTGSPTYKRAFAKAIAGREMALTPEERAAIGLATQGGQYPVPYTVDPSVVLT